MSLKKTKGRIKRRLFPKQNAGIYPNSGPFLGSGLTRFRFVSDGQRWVRMHCRPNRGQSESQTKGYDRFRARMKKARFLEKEKPAMTHLGPDQWSIIVKKEKGARRQAEKKPRL